MIIKSFVGGHSICLYNDCEFDTRIRKYRGGNKILEIPFSGRVLSANIEQSESNPIEYNGAQIPTYTPQHFSAVDPLPSEDECDFCIVSALYVAACKAIGIDTTRLLTIGGVVVDENNNVIGTNWLNRN